MHHTASEVSRPGVRLQETICHISPDKQNIHESTTDLFLNMRTEDKQRFIVCLREGICQYILRRNRGRFPVSLSSEEKYAGLLIIMLEATIEISKLMWAVKRLFRVRKFQSE